MALPKPSKDGKSKSLKKSGALNPHPKKVKASLFADPALDFFDPRDLVQVKYEMLRAVQEEGRPVNQAAEEFGFSRPAYYQARALLEKEGVAGLGKKTPGPKAAHKLTDDVLEYIEEMTQEGQPLRARRLVPLIKERFGKEIHPRSIERAMARRKKKNQ